MNIYEMGITPLNENAVLREYTRHVENQAQKPFCPHKYVSINTRCDDILCANLRTHYLHAVAVFE